MEFPAVFDIVFPKTLSREHFYVMERGVKLTFQEAGEKLVVSLFEDLDISKAHAFETRLTEMIGQGNRIFILDFSRVKYVDSSGIGTIVRIHRQLKEQNGELILAGCGNNLQNIFQLINFPKYFRMCQTVDEALSS